MLEAKINTLEEKLKNLASSSQILDSPAPFRAKANSSTPDYSSSAVDEDVASLTIVMHAQSMLRATPSTTKTYEDLTSSGQ